MFMKHVKMIDNQSLLCFELFSPPESRFVFICSSLKLIILDKHDIIQHFRLYRKMHSQTSQYAILETLKSFQTLDVQSEEHMVFDHSIQDIIIVSLGQQSSKRTPPHQQSKQSPIPLQKTEMIWFALGEQLVFYMKDAKEFKQCMTLDIEKPKAHKCFGRMHHSQLYLLHNQELLHYQITLALPHSTHALLRRLHLQELNENIYFLSLDPITLYGDRGMYKFNEDFSLQQVAKFKWPPANTRKGQENKIVKPESYQFVDTVDYKFLAFPQPQQKIYLVNSQQEVLEQRKISNVMAAAISPNRYLTMPESIGENFELIKESNISGTPYNVMVISFSFDTPELFANNCLGVYSIQQDKLLMIVRQLSHEIDRIYFLTPYDLLYQDSANHVGLIQLSVADIGLVCK